MISKVERDELRYTRLGVKSLEDYVNSLENVDTIRKNNNCKDTQSFRTDSVEECARACHFAAACKTWVFGPNGPGTNWCWFVGDGVTGYKVGDWGARTSGSSDCWVTRVLSD